MPDISPNLSRARKIILVEGRNLITWNAEFDCWILEVQAYESTQISLSINGITEYTPQHEFQVVHEDNVPIFIENSTVRCPYFVKKGTSIAFNRSSSDGSGIVVAPCMYVNA